MGDGRHPMAPCQSRASEAVCLHTQTMKEYHMPRRARTIMPPAVLAIAAAIAMGGCLVSSSKSEHIDGAYIQPGDLADVRVNESDTNDVLDILGEPTRRAKDTDAGTQTWTWNWSRTKKGSGSLFLIFAGSSSEEIDESAHVVFDDDGVVIDKWRD